MKSREERVLLDFYSEDDLPDPSKDQLDQLWASRGPLNLMMMESLQDRSRMVDQREREIQAIVQSISDLNIIFKDLATMISEQVCKNQPDRNSRLPFGHDS